MRASPTNGDVPARSPVQPAALSIRSPLSSPSTRRIPLSTYPAVVAALSSSLPAASSPPPNAAATARRRPAPAPPSAASPRDSRDRAIVAATPKAQSPLPSRSPQSPPPLPPAPAAEPGASAAAAAAPPPPPPPAPLPPLPRRPSFSAFTLLSALRSLNVPAAQWLLDRGARLADEEAEEGCRLLDVAWGMVRDDRIRGEGDEGDEAEQRQRGVNAGSAAPPRLRRSVSSKPAAASSPSEESSAIKRPTLDRRQSTPLPSAATGTSAPLPSSSSTYLALSPLATVKLYRGPVPFSTTLSSLLLLLMPHSADLRLPTLPNTPAPTLSTLLALTSFYSNLHPLLLTVHSNTANLALSHAHILDDINHTLQALADQQSREQEREDSKHGAGGISATQRIAAAQVGWTQKRQELDRAKRDRDRELMDYLRVRSSDVALEAEWAAERVKQQVLKVANEERRAAAAVKEQKRLQRRIDSMARRYEETRRLIAESSQRSDLLAQQTSAFSSQLSLLSAALAAERSKSTQDEVDLASVRLEQQQQCMLRFRPRAKLLRRPLLRDYHPQLRLVLPPSFCLQSSEVVRSTQSPSWSEWQTQISAVGGPSSRFRFDVWDVDEGPNGKRREERLCGCWVTVNEVLLSAGEDMELRLLNGEMADDGEHGGTLWLSAVRMAYIE